MSTSTLPINLTDSYGCLLTGVFLSCILYGVSCLQMTDLFIYLDTGIQTLGKKKALQVLFVGYCQPMLDNSECCLVFPALIEHYGDLAEVNAIHPALYRAMTYSNLIVIIMVSTSIMPGSLASLYTDSGYFIMSLYQLIVIILFLKEPQITKLERNGQLAGEDVILAAGMVLMVLRNGSSEYKRTRKMISRIIFLTANTGFWTAAVALTEVALIGAYPGGLQFTVMEMPLCNIYVNAFLANLNARRYVRGEDYTEWQSSPSHMTGPRPVGTHNSSENRRLSGEIFESTAAHPMIKIGIVKTISTDDPHLTSKYPKV
ncbi:hypothetical protein K435DRAFT_795819 [Dendrothele bispora CBS 962.96]|uniref:DUF6534 domain-containing protein n=1 Tax=Dendrothele bispora (strain CBS 962.96) TaxID=1314807 RepID=A0A4S8M7G9_DENBC|nr:hypothetical protein K435DRAFT_795819 [Dendrothele bispora CBS 962.96]